MTDYQRVSTLFVGAFIGVALCYVYRVSLNPPISTNAENHRNFEIVDTYKGCDVVQWSDHNMATYKYFLDCTK